MDEKHRSAISKAHSRHPMLTRARARGLTSLGGIQAALADAGYPVSKAFLSLVMNRKKACPPILRGLLEDLTGWRVGRS